MDNSDMFTVAEFAECCAREGHATSLLGALLTSAECHGAASKPNRGRHVRATAKAEDVDQVLGGEVMIAVHLLNRSPTRSLQGKTPHEAWQ